MKASSNSKYSTKAATTKAKKSNRSAKHKKSKKSKNPSDSKNKNSHKPGQQPRFRHTNADRLILAERFKVYQKNIEGDNPTLPRDQQKFAKVAEFMREANHVFFEHKPWKIHACTNTLHDHGLLNKPNINPNAKTNHTKITTLQRLVDESFRITIDRQGLTDLDITLQAFTTRAVLINDAIALNPALDPKYQTRSIDYKWGRHFAYKHKDLLHKAEPSEARAAAITQQLQANQQTRPNLCQHLKVYYDPTKEGHYSLTTTQTIKKNTLVDQYRGTHLPTHLRHLHTSNYTIRAKELYIDAAHPYSCFARYINENLDGRKDNTRMDIDSNPTRISIIATQDILPNEEITTAYGPAYWFPHFRTYTLPPDIHNKVARIYGTHYKNYNLNPPPGYTEPSLLHIRPAERNKYEHNVPVTLAKAYHSMDDSETAHESDTSLDEDSTSSYEST